LTGISHLAYAVGMRAVEFIADLSGGKVLTIPGEVAAQLPKTGKARVIVLTADTDEAEWRTAAYEQFLREDPPGDAIYESLR
jgi:hypothetical protein